MKLYYSPGACSLAVRIVINEIGLPCEYEAVDFSTKKTANGRDYFKINAKGAVPALEINEHEILTENAAIQQYLADTHPKSQLLPPIGDFQRYRVLEWLNFVSTDLHKGASPIFTPNVPADVKANVFRPALQSKLAFAEHKLGSKPYLLGDRFTLPDAYLFVILTWMQHLQINMSEYPNLTRYFDALLKRPSIVKSLAQEK
ncbi:MAG: glutathione transferase GstA [Legionellales bacterium]|nr:glutathione transferase GstA [Legionellales bacterium]